jgi:hypothetical protein
MFSTSGRFIIRDVSKHTPQTGIESSKRIGGERCKDEN